ncbi:trigger factor [Kouleothrix aurantiaca]|uniref:Trigger factor n=1 Tax=Kouleothrix aurantiaca TaxID=186479 RepID=A0A0P9D4L0_9CHLR|nr:trigger factor [Kouleothrix aurantiaca]
MKVTSEKLPKSLLALEIELDQAQVEKGLDRAARRLSQKYNIPGFRKGKAPRFIVENYFGRPALIEEASEDLVNKAFKEALDQEKIEPVGRANLETVQFDEPPFSFRVTVPVDPSLTLPDYRAIRVDHEAKSVTDEMLTEAMDSRRERHVVLREPEEPRAAKQGDQLTVQLESFLDGEPLEEREEGTDVPETNVVLEEGRLIPGLYEGLLGIEPDETREIVAHMPEDHANERVRDKDVTFKVTMKRLQERILPEWDELPVLEESESTLDELREKTRGELAETLRSNQEREAIDAYLKQLVEQTEYDIPDALIEQEADQLLHQRGHELERYGITLEQMLQYRGQTHDDAVEELKPEAEERLKTTLALREIVKAEGLTAGEDEVDAEVDRMIETYDEAERDRARELLSTQLRASVASTVIDKKLRERLFAIATGTAPAAPAESAPAAEPAAEPADVVADE